MFIEKHNMPELCLSYRCKLLLYNKTCYGEFCINIAKHRWFREHDENVVILCNVSLRLRKNSELQTYNGHCK